VFQASAPITTTLCATPVFSYFGIWVHTLTERPGIPLHQLKGREAPYEILPEKPPNQVVGRIGRGVRTTFAEQTTLLWRNKLIRRRAVLPFWSLAFGLGPFTVVSLVTDLPSIYWAVALGLLLAALFCGVGWAFEWRLGLRTDLEEWKRDLMSPRLRLILGLPFTPLFPVLHCPCCGERICGLRHWFHCSGCSWADRQTTSGKARRPFTQGQLGGDDV
jgi:hypothetical protein